MIEAPHQILLLDQCLWVLSSRTGISIYDFEFESFLPCLHPWKRPETILAVARIGAFENYEEQYQHLRSDGVQLVHSTEQHLISSRLPNWYPLIHDLTPRSKWYEIVPTIKDIEADFDWPVFVKGVRQTSKHQKSLSIIDSRQAFEVAMRIYRQDPILQWQGIVCREYIPLRPTHDASPERIPSSFEFRTFWWKNELVGCGRYWWEGRPYEMNASERTDAIVVAAEAARRVSVPFLVVDMAQTAEGNWIVIECNDAQESGYAGISPIGLWQNIVAIQKRMTANA